METDQVNETNENADEKINQLRSQINSVDEKIIECLASRRKLVSEIASGKARDGSPLRDSKREQELLVDRIRIGKERGLDAYFVTKVFHEIIDDSVRLQQEYLQGRANSTAPGQAVVRIAFHGIEGSYSHIAARKHFSRYGEQVVFLGKTSFDEVIKAVEQGHADYAILPIENTASGGINDVYDLLLHSQISLVGEEKIPVTHCLIASKNVPLTQIKRVFGRPNVISECGKFISRFPDWQIEYLSDSALSVKRIKDANDSSMAAIASEEAAQLFGLTVLERDISNHRESFNRYIIVARNPIKVDVRIPCKTSLVMATAQRAGSLVEALTVFRDHGINLTKLESRPIPGNPWEEMFYVDFEGNLADERVQSALSEVTKGTRFIKVLGSYPSSDLVRTPVAPEVAAAAAAAPAAKKAAPSESKPAEPAKPKTKKAYKLASRDNKPEDTLIHVGGVTIGGDNFSVIAGPCSVESYDQIMLCAKEAKAAGAHILRGGCFKPRTSPYSFQGLGLQGLDFLAEAGRTFGMPIITEVMSEEYIEPVAAKSDIIQIGARNMQNFSLLKAIGRTQRPIMLKRGLSSTIEDLLMAVEYILSEGNQQVILCERGIRTFETATRNTLDISAAPVLRRLTHLPVFIDPSHAAGERELVPPLALAAKAVGAHGIMVEFHPEPEKALSDGPQALRFPQFEEMMQALGKI
ncbi:MAG: bifunctional 3-deoxy-7-phosphoheptulonate synthase/chorismate mutase [Deltaproteobacteria bacterium]|nr:bifunctional 3-deoxy-7-phosphoheptulonate synthase/chorismate mutase [Deltaproteobacteria bacterium]